LQKRTIILRRLLIVATPYLYMSVYLSCVVNYRSLLQNIVSFIGLFCKRDLSFYVPRISLVSWHKLCKTLQCVAHCNTLQHTAAHCNTPQHTGGVNRDDRHADTTKHCNTLRHTATQCSTLHHTAAHCNTLQHTATHCNTPVGSIGLTGMRTIN